jgi:hypothetical protein
MWAGPTGLVLFVYIQVRLAFVPYAFDEYMGSSLVKKIHELGYMLKPLAQEDGRVCTRERALDWQSLFTVLLCGGNCSKVNPLPRESVMFMSSGSEIPLGSCR